nr:hypothetical protein [Micromonospora inositola]
MDGSTPDEPHWAGDKLLTAVVLLFLSKSTSPRSPILATTATICAVGTSICRKQLQMHFGLEDRNRLVEHVELIKGELSSGPGHPGCDVYDATPAVSDRVKRGFEPNVVVLQQLPSPGVGPCARRAVGGKDVEVRQLEDFRQRPEVVRQRTHRSGCREADRRRDRWEHVVAGEQQALGSLDEDEVTGRVPRGWDRIDPPLAELQRRLAIEPSVRGSPEDWIGWVERDGEHPLSELVCSRMAQQVDQGVVGPIWTPKHVERWALAGTEDHLCTKPIA